MAARRRFAAIFACSLLVSALSAPAERVRWRRGYIDNEVGSSEISEKTSIVSAPITNVDAPSSTVVENRNPPPSNEVIKEIFGTPSTPAPSTTEATTTTTEPPKTNNVQEVISVPLDDDDDDDNDDDDFESMQPASTTNGGSNIFSILNLVTSLFPGSSGNNLLLSLIKNLITGAQPSLFLRRSDTNVADNEIELDYNESKPILQKIETDEETQSESSEEDDSEGSDEDDNTAAEESVEKEEKDQSSKQKESNGDNASVESEGGSDNSDYDSDEPPGGGDGQGGGVLGILAGLSGGEDGQSDLGSLLATVGGIVANLSGDGFDLNSLVASGLGLFVGLLSEGDENPGGVVASYLLTSLDTITGGGAQNNGAFFGTFLSKLIKGTSAAGEEDDSDESSEESSQGSDSAGFFGSLLMALLGNMSKGSSSSHPS